MGGTREAGWSRGDVREAGWSRSARGTGTSRKNRILPQPHRVQYICPGPSLPHLSARHTGASAPSTSCSSPHFLPTFPCVSLALKTVPDACDPRLNYLGYPPFFGRRVSPSSFGGPLLAPLTSSFHSPHQTVQVVSSRIAQPCTGF